jgi:hypothetical protein
MPLSERVEPLVPVTSGPVCRNGNAEARADARAVGLLLALDADVVLLTEVQPALPANWSGSRLTALNEPRVKGGQQHATVAVREGIDMETLPTPGITSAAARLGAVTCVSTVQR